MNSDSTSRIYAILQGRVNVNMTDKEKTKTYQNDIPDDNASQATTLVPDSRGKLLFIVRSKTVKTRLTANDTHIDEYYEKQVQAAARAGLRWGITPKKLHDKNAVPGPDHPVHKIPAEKQEKMRKKGINPVLYAEMNANKLNGKSTFWMKVSQTAMGGGASINC